MRVIAPDASVTTSSFNLVMDQTKHPFDMSAAFCFLQWIYLDYATLGDMNANNYLWRTNQMFNIMVRSDGNLRVQFNDGSGVNNLNVAFVSEMLNTWALVGVSFDGAGEMTAFLKTEAGGLRTGTLTDGGWSTPAAPTFWHLGGASSCPVGAHGHLIVRDHEMTSAEFEAVFDAGPSATQHSYAEGYYSSMAGGAGDDTSVLFEMNHAVLGNPDAGTGAVLGDACSSSGDNIAVHHPGESVSAWRHGDIISSVVNASLCTLRSPYETGEDWSGFFAMQRPAGEDQGSGLDAVPKKLPNWKKLVDDNLAAVIFVILRANSRGVRRSAKPGAATYIVQSWAWAGAYQDHKAQFVGAKTIPCRNFGGNFPCFESLATTSTGTMAAVSGNEADIGRFALTGGTSIGEVYKLSSGGKYESKSGPIAGTKFDGSNGNGTNADFAQRSIRRILKSPNAGTARWRSVSSTSPNIGAGTSTYSVTTDVDCAANERASHTLTGSDSIAAGSISFIPGVDTGDVPEPGMVMFVTSGAASGACATVLTVEGGVGVTVTFEHDLAAVPASGDDVVFVDFEVVTISADHAALGPSDTEIYRGIEVEAVTGDLFFADQGAWNTDATSGVILGQAGWSGNGYGAQIDSRLNTIGGKFPLIEDDPPDVCNLWIAHQSSTYDETFDFADILALSGVSELPISLDMEHPGEGTLDWSQSVITDAAGRGYGAVSVYNSTGNPKERAVNNDQGNEAHPAESGLLDAYQAARTEWQAAALAGRTTRRKILYS